MKRIAILLSFAIFACLPGIAQEKPKTDAKPADAKPADAKSADAKPAAGLPTADAIIDKYISAVGGKEAVMKHTSRTMKGSFEIEAMGMTGTVQIFSKAPNKTAF